MVEIHAYCVEQFRFGTLAHHVDQAFSERRPASQRRHAVESIKVLRDGVHSAKQVPSASSSIGKVPE